MPLDIWAGAQAVGTYGPTVISHFTNVLSTFQRARGLTNDQRMLGVAIRACVDDLDTVKALPPQVLEPMRIQLSQAEALIQEMRQTDWRVPIHSDANYASRCKEMVTALRQEAQSLHVRAQTVRMTEMVATTENLLSSMLQTQGPSASAGDVVLESKDTAPGDQRHEQQKAPSCPCWCFLRKRALPRNAMQSCPAANLDDKDLVLGVPSTNLDDQGLVLDVPPANLDDKGLDVPARSPWFGRPDQSDDPDSPGQLQEERDVMLPCPAARMDDKDLVLQELEDKSGLQIRLQCWDIAGQREYRHMFTLFANDGSLMLVFVNLEDFAPDAPEKNKESAADSLVFWLSGVQMSAPEAPILIVATHKDSIPAESLESTCLLLDDVLRRIALSMPEAAKRWRKMGEHRWFHPIDNSRVTVNHGIAELKRAIENTIQDMIERGSLSNEVPLRYLEAQDIISNFASEGSGWYVNQDWLFQKGRCTGQNDFNALCEYLGKAGMIIHSLHNRKSVVQPMRLAEALAAVFACKRSDGQLSRQYRQAFKQVNMSAGDHALLQQGVLTREALKALFHTEADEGRELLVDMLVQMDFLIKSKEDFVAPFLCELFNEHGLAKASAHAQVCEHDCLLMEFDWPAMTRSFLLRFLTTACNRHDGVLENAGMLEDEHKQFCLLKLGKAGKQATWRIEFGHEMMIKFQRLDRCQADMPDAVAFLDSVLHAAMDRWMPELAQTCKIGPPCPACKQKQDPIAHAISFKQLQDSCVLCFRTWEAIDIDSLPAWVQPVLGQCAGRDMWTSIGDRWWDAIRDLRDWRCFWSELLSQWMPLKNGEKSEEDRLLSVACDGQPNEIVHGSGDDTRTRKHLGEAFSQQVAAPTPSDRTENNASNIATISISGTTAEHREVATNQIDKINFKEARERALQEGSSRPRTVKLLFCGNPRAGKTSTLKALHGERFNPKEDSTHGMAAAQVEAHWLKAWEVVKPDEHVSDLQLGVATAIAKNLVSKAGRIAAVEADRKEELMKVHTTDHVFERCTFSKPTYCAKCEKFLVGFSMQGESCKFCAEARCSDCAKVVGTCSKGPLKDPVHIIAVGSVGVGKSALLNAIAGQRGLFNSDAVAAAVTRRTGIRAAHILGCEVRLVDTPGLTDDGSLDDVTWDIRKAMSELKRLHAILVIIHYQNPRMQPTLHSFLRCLVESFGEEEVMDLLILVFTHSRPLDDVHAQARKDLYDHWVQLFRKHFHLGLRDGQMRVFFVDSDKALKSDADIENIAAQKTEASVWKKTHTERWRQESRKELTALMGSVLDCARTGKSLFTGLAE